MAAASGTRLLKEQLADLGIVPGGLHRNRPSPELIARSFARRECVLAANGAIVVTTGERTGRSPNDRFIVRNEAASDVAWGGVNQPCSPELFEKLLDKARKYLKGRQVFVFDGHAGADPSFRLPVRVVTEATWHALFAQTLFRRPELVELDEFEPAFTIINAGTLKTDPATDGTRSDAFIAIDFSRRIILILGAMYGGEMKKSIFSVVNYLLPQQSVLPMHCAANVGQRGDVALFFGLSGTGKTTLSADPSRRLIGDDEHVWSTHGVFNIEGGCYAKVIRISPTDEPQIFQALRFGCILENVVLHPMSRGVEWNDDSITENTRATYPVEFIPNCVTSGMAGHPRNVFFLACDAYGVLPPISRLTPAMASYHFLSGYTARLAGTEVGVVQPAPTFSTCFGAPFMPRQPGEYAALLAERLATHKAHCWLVNTGWAGGPPGVGRRMRISVTRKLLKFAMEGRLDKVQYAPDPIFKVDVPVSVRGIPATLLHPHESWHDGDAYNEAAKELARAFAANFEQYRPHVPPEVTAAGPQG